MVPCRSLGENVNDIITGMDNHNNCLPQLCRICASILTGGCSCEVKGRVESIKKGLSY